MKFAGRDRVYRLLPAAQRGLDQGEGEPLRAFLSVMEEQLDALQDDVEALYRDWFIETCDEWVVPYLADLLGVEGLHDGAEGMPSRRALVANALRDRRLKGVATSVESQARGITGWHARVVHGRDLVLRAPHANHARHAWRPEDEGSDPPSMREGGAYDVRTAELQPMLDAPFDRASHTPDVRGQPRGGGWHDLQGVALFLWRSEVQLHERVPAAPAGGPPGAYWHASPLGGPVALFNLPRPELGDAGAPAPLSATRVRADLARLSTAPPGARPSGHHYGPEASLEIFSDVPFDGGPPREDGLWPVAASDLLCQRLEPWDQHPTKVLVDPRLGRISFPRGREPTRVETTHCLGFAGDLGGGPYERDARDDDGEAKVVRVAALPPVGAEGPWAATLAEAYALAGSLGHEDPILEICDGRAYAFPSWDVPEGCILTVRAASGVRPVLLPAPDADGRPTARITGGSHAAFRLEGVLLVGRLVLGGNLSCFDLVHATLAPGLGLAPRPSTSDEPAAKLLHPGIPSLVSEPHVGRLLRLRHAIAGPIDAHGAQTLDAADSILDAAGRAHAVGGPDGGPLGRLARCTLLGPSRFASLDADDSLFQGRVDVRRVNVGRVSHSYVPLGSRAPRLVACQPSEGVDPPEAPVFASLAYGAAAYAQLTLETPSTILRGAADGGEMGAFSFLKRPQREDVLLANLDDLVPMGLDARLTFIS